MKEIEAIAIFLTTMFFIIKQPKNISIGISASIGALISFLLGLVSLENIYTVVKIVWDASLAFIGIVFISILLDHIGFFEWISLKAIDKANGNGKKLYIYMILIGALISIFLANDGAALMLTPIVYSKIKHLNLKDDQAKAYMIGSGFISDTASLSLIISNLTNIITADFFNISFLMYLKNMFFVNVVSIVSSLAVLWLFYRKHILPTFDKEVLEDKKPEYTIKDRFLFNTAWIVGVIAICILLVSHIVKIPTSLVIISAAFILILANLKNNTVSVKRILFKETPWQILTFSIGMYIVVYALQNIVLVKYMPYIIEFFLKFGTFVSVLGIGFISGILSALINNLPTVMIVNLNIKALMLNQHLEHTLAFANIIGTNIGPKMTPIGSLATMLWLHVLNKKGLNISYAYYIKVGIILTIPVLLSTLISLYLIRSIQF